MFSDKSWKTGALGFFQFLIVITTTTTIITRHVVTMMVAT